MNGKQMWEKRQAESKMTTWKVQVRNSKTRESEWVLIEEARDEYQARTLAMMKTKVRANGARLDFVALEVYWCRSGQCWVTVPE